MHGDPQNEIVKKAQEVKADIVVVGSHGSGLLKRLVQKVRAILQSIVIANIPARTLLGSVSQYCVNHCHCTVVVAKPPHPEVNSTAAASHID
jgi:nucleotide-binding universal stress UspA family protein